MTFLARLNRPWVHFIAIGVLLFYVQGKLFPTPKPVVGPLGEARIETLLQQWMSSVGKPPSQEQRAHMIRSELDRDMLFQRAVELELYLYDTVVYQRLLRNMHFLQLGEGKTEQELYEQALEMRLHLGDEVVKRRMIQVMEQLLLASNPPESVTEAELAAEFAERSEELRRPPRYSIEHLYFNRDHEADIDSVVEMITQQGLNPEQAREMSSPFLPGYRFVRQTPDQLARHFGAAFVNNLEGAGPVAGNWLGPIRSTYGLHYVWVSELEESRDAELEEVQAQLQRDIESRKRSAALEQSVSRLRERYEVVL